MPTLPEYKFNLDDPNSRRIASFISIHGLYKNMKVYVNPAAGAILDKDPNHVFQSNEVMWVEVGEEWYGMHHYEDRPAIIFDKKRTC